MSRSAGRSLVVATLLAVTAAQSTVGAAARSPRIAPAPGALVSAASAVPVEIPDEAAASSALAPEHFGTIADLDLAVTVSHEYVGDLSVTIANATTSVELLVAPICSGRNVDVVFDDEASAAAADTCDAAADPAIDGRLRPANALDAFDGQQLTGTWTLTVSDGAEGDTGAIIGWAVHAVLREDAGLDIGVLSTVGDATARSALIAGMAGTGDFVSIATIRVDETVPTAADLEGLDALVVDGSDPSAKPRQLGAALADYVDGGGGVVLAGNGLRRTTVGGRIAAEPYVVIAAVNGPLIETAAALEPVDTGHPLLVGVDSLVTSRHLDVEPAAGAHVVAVNAADGELLAGTRLVATGRLVALNLPTAEGGPLLANALAWAARPVATCDGQLPTIEGTAGADRLTGTADDDVIVGYGGADRILASGGDDVVCGGRGNDVLIGGTGEDRLLGERGADVARGGRGDDICRAERRNGC